MIAAVLLILASWLVLGSVFAYILLAAAGRLDVWDSRPDLDAELRTLIDQHLR